MMDGVKTFVAYARVSTIGQSNASLEVQLTYLKRASVEYSECIFREFREKASGSSIDGRAIFSSLLDKLEDGDILAVYDNSRLGRSTEDNLSIAKSLASKNVRLFINGKIVNIADANDMLMLSIESAVSTFYRANQNAKSLAGIEVKKTNGEWIFSSRLFGYSLSYISSKPVITVVESEAEIVQTIFQRYSKGDSMREISTHLKNNGFRLRHGGEFTTAQVRRILLRPIYAGVYLVDGPKQNRDYASIKLNPKNLVKSLYYPPIISEDQFWAVYNSHRKVNRKHSVQFEYRWSSYPLTSVIRCSCGRPYIHTYEKRGERVFSKYTSTNHSSECTSAPVSFRAEPYEALFKHLYYITHLWSYEVLKLLQDQKEEQQRTMHTIDKDVERIDAAITTVNKKIGALVRAIEDGMPLDSIRSRLSELNEDKNQLEKRKAQLIAEQTTDEDELERLADALTDEALIEFNTLSVADMRKRYLEVFYSVIQERTLVVSFAPDIVATIPLQINSRWSLQDCFNIEITHQGKPYTTLFFDGQKMTSEDKMMSARLDSIYKTLID